MLAIDVNYARATARAFAGAILFAFPLLMTMEMWSLGFAMDPLRLALFLALSIPALTGLSFYAGFEETFDLREDVIDALAAFAVGVIASAVTLFLFGLIRDGQPLGEIVGKIAVQTVPAGIGAMLARKQLGQKEENQERHQRQASYLGILFMMAMGALFVAFNVAPTEEMILIAYKMTPWHAIAVLIASLIVLHTFVYAIGFAGERDPGDAGFWSLFLRFSAVGYGVALLVSLYVLWTFGRTDTIAPMETFVTTIVLGFPASLGAATARLIL